MDIPVLCRDNDIQELSVPVQICSLRAPRLSCNILDHSGHPQGGTTDLVSLLIQAVPGYYAQPTVQSQNPDNIIQDILFASRHKS